MTPKAISAPSAPYAEEAMTLLDDVARAGAALAAPGGSRYYYRPSSGPLDGTETATHDNTTGR